MRELTQSEKRLIEALIDTHGLKPVIEALSEICGAKAEYLSKDIANVAKLWAIAEGKLGVLSTEVGV
jgi:hypothetical protein